MGRARKSRKVVNRPRKPGEVFATRAAIRNHCISCCAGQTSEVRKCALTDCHLWPYRLGLSGVAPETAAIEQQTAEERPPHAPCVVEAAE